MTAVPVVLFAYDRPEHLRRTLSCLRENRVPSIYAFSDGPRTPDRMPAVARVRDQLRTIDWCDVVLCERESNLGLGRSVLTGVTEVFGTCDAAIVFEDDLVCVPGTYDYLSAALQRYRGDSRVMSVTGWTHPRVTPSDVDGRPYFDGRAECLVWGTWSTSWRGMQDDAQSLLRKAAATGADVYRYGADLPGMAAVEAKKNIWAVRWLYWHILNRGLCLRPPWSMVEHIGFDKGSSNCSEETWFVNPPLRSCPPIPERWPEPAEHPECSTLWRQVCGERPTITGRLCGLARRVAVGVREAVSSR